ncbi:hypothetical protein D3C78_1051320 [compost metagenome]
MQQRLHVAIHACGIFFGIAQDQTVATLIATALNAAHDFGIKRVIAGGNQHADGTRLVQFEAARQCRRRIVQLFNGRHDFGPHAVADKAIVINDVRDRRG